MANITTPPEGQYTWAEPESPFNPDEKPVYPHNKVWETESGHSFEMDDTKDRERIRLQHRSKTFIEMHPDGSEVHKIYGNGYEIVLENKNVLIKGHCSVTIEGDSVVHVKGDKIEKIDGNLYQEISGEMVTNVKGKTSFLSNDDMTVGVGDPTSGILKFRTADSTYIEGDLSVTGSITSLSLTTDTKVNAGTGVTAGHLGFVTETGGVSVGIPVSSPIGIINCLSYINVGMSLNAGVSVNAPFINGFMVKDVSGTMMAMRTVYNAHIHPAPRGMTGTPISTMTLM